MIPWHWLIPTFIIAFTLGSALRAWADKVNAHSKEPKADD